MNSSVKNKTAWIIVISLIASVIVALVGVAVGHKVYSDRQEAKITDFGVLESSDEGLVYRYEDGIKAVDLDGAFTVSSGADYEIVKIKDEDGTVSRGSGKIVDLSGKPYRIATVQVTSASQKNVTDYKISFIPRSSENNLIKYNLGGGIIDGDYFSRYSGSSDILLPIPTKSHTSKATGIVYESTFEGWFTTPDFQEGTEISVIPKGADGEIALYAKFAPVIQGSRDGYQYIEYGYYPQDRVADYALLKQLRDSSEYAAVKGNSIGFFDFNGNHYCYFIPDNVPNLAENGYSAGTTYFFHVQPIEWRVCLPQGQTASAGNNYTLLATSILNCGAYSDNGGTIQNMYQKYVNQNNFDLSGFEKRYFDPDTMYYDGIKSVVDGVYNTMAGLPGYNPSGVSVHSRSFSRYKNVFNGTESYSCNMWLLNYSEVRDTALGFSSNYKDNDPLRKAYCTDFAAANGVYRSTSLAHLDQGSWWLRGAGFDYDYKNKHVAYVKYTGYVHTYGAMNFAIRSGIRPSMTVSF